MRVAFDIDDTLLLYTEWISTHRKFYSEIKYPQASKSFYEGIPENKSAVWFAKFLSNLGHDIIFVSQPPDARNVSNISGKFKRMIELFGADVVSKIYLAFDKSLIDCDLLIDDRKHDVKCPVISFSEGISTITNLINIMEK